MVKLCRGYDQDAHNIISRVGPMSGRARYHGSPYLELLSKKSPKSNRNLARLERINRLLVECQVENVPIKSSTGRRGFPLPEHNLLFASRRFDQFPSWFTAAAQFLFVGTLAGGSN
jgi:hypothetical protein